MAEKGEKDESGRFKIGLRLDLIPSCVLLELSKVFHHGAQKYGEENWKNMRMHRKVFEEFVASQTVYCKRFVRRKGTAMKVKTVEVRPS